MIDLCYLRKKIGRCEFFSDVFANGGKKTLIAIDYYTVSFIYILREACGFNNECFVM